MKMTNTWFLLISLSIIGIFLACGIATADEPYVIPALPFTISEEEVALHGTHYFVLSGDWTGTEHDVNAIQITASDIVFDGNGHQLAMTGNVSNTTWAIGAGTYVSNVTVQNVTVTGWDLGVTFGRVSGGMISEVSAISNNVSGATVVLCSDILVTGCTFSGTPGDTGTGIQIDRSGQVTVTGSEFSGNVHKGIGCANSTDILLDGNHISGSNDFGILADDSNRNVVVDHAFIEGISDHCTGVFAGGSEVVGVFNSSISGCGGNALAFDHMVRGSIINNTVTSCGYGIGVFESCDVSVNENRVNAMTGGDGIFISDSTRVWAEWNEACGNFHNGVVFSNVTDGCVLNSTTDGNQDNGIGIWDGCRNIAAGFNHAAGTIAGQGISVDNGTNIDVFENTVLDIPYGAGILYNWIQGGNIVNNTCGWCRYSGISVTESSDISVNGNRAGASARGDGICIVNSTRIWADGNDARGNFYTGITFSNVTRGAIQNSTAWGNVGNGIGVWDGSSNISVGWNTATGTFGGPGIRVSHVQNIDVFENNASGNLQDAGIIAERLTGGNFVNNTADRCLYAGIAVAESSDLGLYGNRANQSGGDGILVQDSARIFSERSMTSGNLHNGITFGNVTDGCILNSSVSENPDHGVQLIQGSSLIVVASASIEQNGDGIHFDAATGGNLVSDNWFNNTLNVNIEGGNPGNDWNITRTAGQSISGGHWLGGNYWATPSGDGWSQVTPDSDWDGICDAPYVLSGMDTDYLPLAVLPPPPQVSSVSPKSHARDGVSFLVTIKGSGFFDTVTGTKVSLDRAGSTPIKGTKVKVVSPAKMTFSLKIPAKAKIGKWNVTVTNPDGQTVTRVNRFTVKA